MPILALVLTVALHPLERAGVEHLYNLEFDQAVRVFEALSHSQPGSPAGPHHLATTLWMKELERRGALAGETFQSSAYWTRTRKQPMPAGLEKRFRAEVESAVKRSKEILEQRPDDREALYFWGATESVVSAFESTLAGAYFAAYRAGRRARKQHLKLLEIDPDYADACLVPGVYEYTLASLPRSVRLLTFLIGARGSKTKGVALLERAARDGRRARWGARLLLIVVREREKRYGEALDILKEMESAFPRNAGFALERGWVLLLKKDWGAARAVFEEIRRRRAAGEAQFDRLPEALILLRLGESFLFQKRYAEARDRFSAGLATPGTSPPLRAWLHLRRGQAHDALRARQAAVTDYRKTLDLDTDKSTRRAAERFIKRPYP